MAKPVVIFVVDDEELVAEVLRAALEDAGYEVEDVRTGKDAFHALDAGARSFDIIVTDINLGGKLTGWDVAKHARALSPDLPVIYMSGYADNEWTANGVPYSAILSKPFPPNQLVTAVATLLTKGLIH